MDFKKLGIEENSTVNEGVISSVEEKLGCQLPQSYYDLVRFNHEPEPEACEFDYGSQSTCVSEFFRFTDDESYEYGILAYRPSITGVAERYVPIARDPGDALICFDRERNFALVILDRDNGAVDLVAKTFGDFLSSLR